MGAVPSHGLHARLNEKGQPCKPYSAPCRRCAVISCLMPLLPQLKPPSTPQLPHHEGLYPHSASQNNSSLSRLSNIFVSTLRKELRHTPKAILPTRHGGKKSFEKVHSGHPRTKTNSVATSITLFNETLVGNELCSEHMSLQ